LRLGAGRSACTWVQPIGWCSASTAGGGHLTARRAPASSMVAGSRFPSGGPPRQVGPLIITGWVEATPRRWLGKRKARWSGPRSSRSCRCSTATWASCARACGWPTRMTGPRTRSFRRGLQLRRRRRHRGAVDPGSVGRRDTVPGRRGRGGGGEGRKRHRAGALASGYRAAERLLA
jgi:hypothetical protein